MPDSEAIWGRSGQGLSPKNVREEARPLPEYQLQPGNGLASISLHAFLCLLSLQAKEPRWRAGLRSVVSVLPPSCLTQLATLKYLTVQATLLFNSLLWLLVAFYMKVKPKALH